MLLDQLLERNSHFLFDVARRLDVPGNAEDLGAVVVLRTERGEPSGAPPEDRRRVCDGLDVVHRGRTAPDADARRKRRLRARLALLAFEALDQRTFLAADVRAHAAMDEHVHRPARAAGVRPEEPGRIGLVDGILEDHRFVVVLAAHVDVGGVRADREARDQAALDQLVRIVAEDFAILAGARLALVGVDHEVARQRPVALRHERPLHPRRKSRATTAAQARLLGFVDDPVATLFEDRAGAVPIAARHRRLEIGRLEAVEIGVDAVFVAQHQGVSFPASGVLAFSVVGPLLGHEPRRPLCEPIAGLSPLSRASSTVFALS